MNKYLVLGLIVLALTSVAGCAGAAQPPGAPAISAPATSAPLPATTAPGGGGSVKLTTGKIVIAVLNDQSGVYADLSGKNSVEAVKMAVEDFNAKYGTPFGQIDVITADHQNKPDVASQKAQEFYDRDGADVILDVPTSSAALAVANIAKQKKKLFIDIGAASNDLTGAQCNKYTFHYAYDTYMLAQGTTAWVTQNVGKKWYIIYPNYAFGQDMDKSFTAALQKNGGTVVSADPSPWPNTTGDFSTLLLKAPTLNPKPDVLGAMNAGGDLVNLVKQYGQFKLKDQGITLAIGLLFDTDIKALWPDQFDNFTGVVYTTPWIWTEDDAAKAFADRFQKRVNTRPTFAHAGNYSAAWQYLDAVRRAGTDDADAVVKALEGYTFSDFFIHNGKVRPEDHFVMHDALLAQVKAKSDVKEVWDWDKILSTLPADQVARPLAEANCKMNP